MDEDTLALLDGLHFHTLCEQNSDDLKTTLQAVEEKFGDILTGMKWLNMGGGHHITRPDYDLAALEDCIRHAQQAWGVTVYLEPGEAVALNAGYFVSRVLDLSLIHILKRKSERFREKGRPFFSRITTAHITLMVWAKTVARAAPAASI